MTHPRAWAWALLAIGIVVGTLTDEDREPIVPRSGDYWILSGDFHVHAAPGDGTLPPWELRREARRAGLDVFAISNHNMTSAARLGRWWGSYFPGPHPIMMAGEEITNPAYHLIAVGISRTVDGRQPAASAIEAVHAQGGVAIAAHPGRAYWNGFDEKALALLDGAEAVNDTAPVAIRDYGEFRRRAQERNPDLAAIGSSDFHGAQPMGRCRTYLFARERSEAGVLEAIRSGRTVAADDKGRLYGDPELVGIIEANRPAGRSDRNAGWRRLSVALAWVGVLGLILLGRRS